MAQKVKSSEPERGPAPVAERVAKAIHNLAGGEAGKPVNMQLLVDLAEANRVPPEATHEAIAQLIRDDLAVNDGEVISLTRLGKEACEAHGRWHWGGADPLAVARVFGEIPSPFLDELRTQANQNTSFEADHIALWSGFALTTVEPWLELLQAHGVLRVDGKSWGATPEGKRALDQHGLSRKHDPAPKHSREYLFGRVSRMLFRLVDGEVNKQIERRLLLDALRASGIQELRDMPTLAELVADGLADTAEDRVFLTRRGVSAIGATMPANGRKPQDPTANLSEPLAASGTEIAVGLRPDDIPSDLLRHFRPFLPDGQWFQAGVIASRSGIPEASVAHWLERLRLVGWAMADADGDTWCFTDEGRRVLAWRDEPQQTSTEPESRYILVSDIAGWSKLTLPEIVTFVERAFPRIVELLQKPNGVNTWGDGMVVTYDDKNPKRVAQVALDLRDYFRHKEHGVDKVRGIRIAIHDGMAMELYNPITRRVDVWGEAVHTPARLEPVVPLNEVLCTDTVARKLTEVAGSEGWPSATKIPFKVNLAKDHAKEDVAVVRRAGEATNVDDVAREIEVRQTAGGEQARARIKLLLAELQGQGEKYREYILNFHGLDLQLRLESGSSKTLLLDVLSMDARWTVSHHHHDGAIIACGTPGEDSGAKA